MSDTTIVICLHHGVEKGILKWSQIMYYVVLATKHTQLKWNAFKGTEEDESYITNDGALKTLMQKTHCIHWLNVCGF